MELKLPNRMVVADLLLFRLFYLRKICAKEAYSLLAEIIGFTDEQLNVKMSSDGRNHWQNRVHMFFSCFQEARRKSVVLSSGKGWHFGGCQTSILQLFSKFEVPSLPELCYSRIVQVHIRESAQP